MKRIISLLLSTICTVMMISTLAFAAETSLEDAGLTVVRLNRREHDTLYVKTDGGNLNVRSGAGTEYAIVGKLANGTKIDGWSIFGRVDSEGRSWTNITAKDINGKSVTGWVLDEYLTATPPSRAVPVGIGPDVG